VVVVVLAVVVVVVVVVAVVVVVVELPVSFYMQIVKTNSTVIGFLTAHIQFEYYRNGWRLEEFLLSATSPAFYILFCRVLIPSANTPAPRQISKIRISSKQQKSYLE